MKRKAPKEIKESETPITPQEPKAEVEIQKESIEYLIQEIFPALRVLPLTNDEIKQLDDIVGKTMITRDETNIIENIYKRVFQKQSNVRICRSCPTIWIQIMKDLTKLHGLQNS